MVFPAARSHRLWKRGKQGRREIERDGPDRRVHGACDDLGVRLLTFDVGDGGRVTGEDMYLGFGAHVPYAGGGVSARGDEDVESGVQAERIYAREMTVVLPYDLVDFEVPAFDRLRRVRPAQMRGVGTHLVFTTREQIGVSRRNGEATDGGDVAGQGQFEGARGEIPNFDDAVACAGCEPGVPGLDGDAADPAQMAGDDTDEFPGGVVGRFDGARGLVEGERFGEFGRGGKGGGLCFWGVVDGCDHARGVARCWVGLVSLRAEAGQRTGIGEEFLV